MPGHKFSCSFCEGYHCTFIVEGKRQGWDTLPPSPPLQIHLCTSPCCNVAMCFCTVTLCMLAHNYVHCILIHQSNRKQL